MMSFLYMVCMFLFLSIAAQDNYIEDFCEQKFEQLEFDSADYDAIPVTKPIKPISRWQQWATSLADIFMMYYDELQGGIKYWCKDSTQWIALQLRCLKENLDG